MMATTSMLEAPSRRSRRPALGSVDLWRHELGRARLGVATVALFAVALACYLVVLALADRRITGWDGLRQPGWTWVQGFLPVICGLGVAGVLGAAPTFELHLALPTSLRAVLLRRLALVLGAAFLLGLVGWAAFYPPSLWAESVLSTALQVLAPLLLLGGVAALAAAASGSSRAAAGAVVLLWIGAMVWQQSDTVVLVAGVALLVAAYVALGSSEHLLRAAAE